MCTDPNVIFTATSSTIALFNYGTLRRNVTLVMIVVTLCQQQCVSAEVLPPCPPAINKYVHHHTEHMCTHPVHRACMRVCVFTCAPVVHLPPTHLYLSRYVPQHVMQVTRIVVVTVIVT